MLTQTIPGDGGGWYCAGAEFEALEEEAAGALDEAGAPGGTGADEDAVRPPETVTIDEILVMVPCETPARERSVTDEYGRPAMIFFAVTAPTPGRASRSFSDAEFRSTGPLAAPPLFAGALEDADAGAEAEDEDEERLAETVTIGEIFWIVAAETPAFERSATEP